MQQIGPFISKHGLNEMGITNTNVTHWNYTTPALYEEALRRQEGALSHLGPLVVRTGHHTGRSPKDKFVVKESTSEKNVWWGDVNRPYDQKNFNAIKQRIFSYLQGRDLYVQDCFAGADPEYRLPVRVINEYAWHNLFVRNMFRRAQPEELKDFTPGFTIIDVPRFHAIPEIDNTNSEVFVLMDFSQKLVLIGGTSYAGEMKKSIFTVMNYLLPLKDVLSMHCSANVGKDGDSALFFGLSGTGKTTLSADASRTLIGDDEHGWSDRGIFNFEGGCYAKVINLSEQAEPEIYQTTRMFGTVLENVMMHSFTRRLDLNDSSLTENTRAAYPLSYIPNASETSIAGHPKNIIMLTADAFGVLPPISKLTPAQAMYHFMSGYTAKVAGTEKGVTEPQATFSTCFGAPFMVHKPAVYAKLLGEKIAQHQVNCWLVNTGWSGGPYGVGSRMKIEYTRAMIHAALDGRLAEVPASPDKVFGVHVPESCPNVPSEVLQPRNTWSDKDAYDQKANDLAGRFNANFKQYDEGVSPEIKEAAPKQI